MVAWPWVLWRPLGQHLLQGGPIAARGYPDRRDEHILLFRWRGRQLVRSVFFSCVFVLWMSASEFIWVFLVVDDWLIGTKSPNDVLLEAFDVHMEGLGTIRKYGLDGWMNASIVSNPTAGTITMDGETSL